MFRYWLPMLSIFQQSVAVSMTISINKDVFVKMYFIFSLKVMNILKVKLDFKYIFIDKV